MEEGGSDSAPPLRTEQQPSASVHVNLEFETDNVVEVGDEGACYRFVVHQVSGDCDFRRFSGTWRFPLDLRGNVDSFRSAWTAAVAHHYCGPPLAAKLDAIAQQSDEELIGGWLFLRARSPDGSVPPARVRLPASFSELRVCMLRYLPDAVLHSGRPKRGADDNSKPLPAPQPMPGSDCAPAGALSVVPRARSLESAPPPPQFEAFARWFEKKGRHLWGVPPCVTALDKWRTLPVRGLHKRDRGCEQFWCDYVLGSKGRSEKGGQGGAVGLTEDRPWLRSPSDSPIPPSDVPVQQWSEKLMRAWFGRDYRSSDPLLHEHEPVLREIKEKRILNGGSRVRYLCRFAPWPTDRDDQESVPPLLWVDSIDLMPNRAYRDKIRDFNAAAVAAAQASLKSFRMRLREEEGDPGMAKRATLEVYYDLFTMQMAERPKIDPNRFGDWVPTADADTLAAISAHTSEEDVEETELSKRLNKLGAWTKVWDEEYRIKIPVTTQRDEDKQRLATLTAEASAGGAPADLERRMAELDLRNEKWRE